MKKTLLVVFGLLLVLSPALKAQQSLVIVKAIYTGGDVQKDVTEIVQGKIRNGQNQISVQNDELGGDPKFGEVKTLTVVYRDASGDHSLSAEEGETLTIPNAAALSAVPPAVPSPTNESSDTKRLAQEGVFFLRERVSVTTDSGISAFPQGTRVVRVGESGGKIRVKSGDQVFEVESEKLTRDVAVASALQNDAQQQAFALAQASEARLAQHLEKEQQAQAQAAVADQARSEQAALQASANRIAASKPPKGSSSTPGVHVLRVEGEVLQVLSDGVLLAGGWRSRTLEPDGVHDGAIIYDEPLFVAGVSGLVDGAQFAAVVYPAGRYTYTAVTGAGKTVHRYAMTPQAAARYQAGR